jgi:putative ABC transport system permease protein
VSPDYFATLGIPLREGRVFANDDVTGRPPVAIINEEMARQFWSGQSAIGHQLASGVGPRAAVTTVVGVVGNVRPPLQTGIGPQIYVSYLQQSEPSITLLVRNAAGVVSPEAIKQAVWSVEPDQPLFDIRPMSEVVAQSVAQPRLVAEMLGGFALLALVMSGMGVYMVVTYLTSRRAREIALRRAIGADSVAVVTLLAGQTMRWTLAGLAIGIAGAVAASGALRRTLIGIGTLDAWTVSLAAAVYLLVVAIAVGVPAARALRLDPATVLRAE